MDENVETVAEIVSNSSPQALIIAGVSVAVGVVGTLGVLKLRKKLAEKKAAAELEVEIR